MTTTTEITPASVAAMSDSELDRLLANLLEQIRYDHPILYHADGACRTAGCFRCESAAPRYSTDPAANAEAVAAIEAAEWDWTLKSYMGPYGERLYLMRATKTGRVPVDVNTRARTRTVAECCALALAAVKVDAK